MLARLSSSPRLLIACALTLASLLLAVAVSTGVACGTPEPSWLFVSSLFTFAIGFVWGVSELARPRLLAMPIALAVYLAVGPAAMAVARTVSDNGDLQDEATWIPFWLYGLLLATDVLPGSC